MTKKTIREFLVITVGTVIISAAVYFFLMPSHVSVGSISGLAVVIANFLPLPVSVITMILNTALLIIGFLCCGKEFGGKTVYTSILLPVMLWVWEQLLPQLQSLTADPFLDMICYVGVVSIGLAMLFNVNASSGGLDIVAKLLNKYLHMELGSAMSLAGMCVALSSAFVYDIKTVILSVVGTYLNGIVLDHFILGFDMKKRVCILSHQYETVRRFILDELHSGASIYETVGAYTEQSQKEIITIVDKQEYRKLMDFIAVTDPDAFVTVYNVNKIIYRAKR